MARQTLSDLRATVAVGPPYPEGFIEGLARDIRAGARLLHTQCLRAQARKNAVTQKTVAMLAFEREAEAGGFSAVAGVDEAGRGPLAGPVVAAAVVLREPVAGLDDSKRLTAAQRATLFAELMDGGHAIGVGAVAPEDIDRVGIQSANYRAMADAVYALSPPADFLLVDGFHIAGCALPQKRIVKGDARSQSIAAASIIAKVTRDRLMDELDHQYPGYGFARHKGYATAKHLDAVERLGACPAHRRSFAPIAAVCESGSLF
jgi:ribonuclease HII